MKLSKVVFWGTVIAVVSIILAVCYHCLVRKDQNSKPPTSFRLELESTQQTNEYILVVRNGERVPYSIIADDDVVLYSIEYRESVSSNEWVVWGGFSDCIFPRFEEISPGTERRFAICPGLELRPGVCRLSVLVFCESLANHGELESWKVHLFLDEPEKTLFIKTSF